MSTGLIYSSVSSYTPSISTAPSVGSPSAAVFDHASDEYWSERESYSPTSHEYGTSATPYSDHVSNIVNGTYSAYDNNTPVSPVSGSWDSNRSLMTVSDLSDTEEDSTISRNYDRESSESPIGASYISFSGFQNAPISQRSFNYSSGFPSRHKPVPLRSTAHPATASPCASSDPSPNSSLATSGSYSRYLPSGGAASSMFSRAKSAITSAMSGAYSYFRRKPRGRGSAGSSVIDPAYKFDYSRDMSEGDELPNMTGRRETDVHMGWDAAPQPQVTSLDPLQAAFALGETRRD
ncbi:hypothetical protein CI109_106054 [Kwoniella shandongensis]|uniref:Uncharacterized protein n=1 Tax=Kwoniella shandongensis TaxID=1734106 RepID=A0AAJ8LLI3_9TREE